MRTRKENIAIIRNASGGIFSAGSSSGERTQERQTRQNKGIRTREQSLRIIRSAATDPVLPVTLDPEATKDPGTRSTAQNHTGSFAYAQDDTKSSSVILRSEATKDPVNRTPTGDSYRQMSGIAVARPGTFSTGEAGRPAPAETRPMGYGGGGTVGGGGGRGGRADTRANLQRQLNALDEAAAYVTTTEQSDGIEQQRRPIIEQLRQMDEEEGRTGVYTAGDRLKNAAANTKLIAQQGLTIADHTIAQTADWLFGGIAKEGRALLNTTLQSINPDWGFENEDPLITQYNKKGAEALAHNQAIAEKRIEEGKLDPTVWKYGTQVVAAIPDAVLALLTYGSSSAAQATTKSLEAASRLARGGKLYQKVAPLVQSTVDMMKSPQWMSAFARSAGSSYEAALADGATEEQATLYALVNSYANATIEVGGGDEALGGIQKLPKQLQELIKKGDSSRILAWVKSTGSEVLEESLQSILERGLRTVYSDDVPLYAREDPNAIINPKMMLEEAKGAFITGSLLSGGQVGVNSVHRALQTPARVNVNDQTLTESENIAALPEKVTDFPADPGDLETLNQETTLALNQDWEKPEDSPYVDNNSLQKTEQHDTILLDYPLDRSNIVSDGSHINRGKLLPNCTYTTGEHGYIYVTNERSLIEYARADELQLKEHDQRLPHSRNTLGKLPGDDAGHLFGDLFGGSPKLDNLVSQARDVNRKEFRKIEREWEAALRNKQTVSAEIKIDYEAGSSRPSKFTIYYSIDGLTNIKIIYN